MDLPELRPYQEQAVAHLDRVRRGIYADAPGTGKTPATLQWLRDIDNQPTGGPRRHLIVAPLPVLDHWVEEAAVWYPDLTMVVGAGTPTERADARVRASTAKGHSVLLLHYEGLRIESKALSARSGAFDTLVCDEAHRLKGRSTLVTKAARLMARRVARVALLTGTPVMNRAEELWSLLNLLDPGEYTSFWRFVHTYFETEQRNYHTSPRPVTIIGDVKPERLDDLRALVRPVMIQRTLDECLPNLAEAVEILHPATLTPAERKAYKALDKHSWLDLGGGKILQAENHLAKATRLRQMASDCGSVLSTGTGGKALAAIELCQGTLVAEQVVVLTAYKATARAIAEALGDEAVIYTGDEDELARRRALSSFKAGKARVLVGTLATLGEGVDGLQVARYLVMVDRDWTPARNEQAIARLRRSGQGGTVVVYHVFAEGTIDEDVAQALAKKEEVIASLKG